MAYSISQNQLNPLEEAKLLAQSNLADSFKSNVFVLNFFSKDISLYLTDYFLILNDLRLSIREEERKGFSEYSFVVFPVHKAFECYLANLFEKIFKFAVSYKPNETTGHYLAFSDAEKEKQLDELKKRFSSFVPNVTKKKWLDVWSALDRQWKANRNLLTHSNGEKISTLKQAELAANAIIREIHLSSQLFQEEFFDPFVIFIKKRQEPKDSNKQNG